ncbi:MAG: hypothetical protein ACOYN4_13300 [Bacteroidales bacterium]
MEPYKQYGLWYYPILPEGMRLATLPDFFTPENTVKIGVDFLVKSDFDQEYEAHRILDESGLTRWIDYINAGKIYIKANG